MRILAIAPIALYGALSVSAHESPYENLHPCEKDFDNFEDIANCLKAMYKEFNQVTKGKFSKPMKKGIKKISQKMKFDSPSSPTSESTITVSSASSNSTISHSPFESVPCTYAEGCVEGFCKIDYNLEGMCEVCPAAGEMCDPTLTTYTDFSNCCNTCPGAICDTDAWKDNWTSYRDTLDVVPDVALMSSRKYLFKTETLDSWTNEADLVRRDTAGAKGCLGYKMYEIHSPNSTHNWDNVGYWDSMENLFQYLAWRGATLYNTSKYAVEGSEAVSTGFFPVILDSVMDTDPVPVAGVVKTMPVQPDLVEEFLLWFTTNVVSAVKEFSGCIAADVTFLSGPDNAPTNVVHFTTEWETDSDADNFNNFFQTSTVAAWLEDSADVTDTRLFVPELFRTEQNQPYWGPRW